MFQTIFIVSSAIIAILIWLQAHS